MTPPGVYDLAMRRPPQRLAPTAAIAAALGLLAPRASAEPPRFRLDGGLTLSRFEQQVKTEIGGARGERLVEETQLDVSEMLSYRFWGPFSAGGYMQIDVGRREAGRFVAFDAQNAAVTSGRVGGAFAELWMGPFVRAEWRMLFAELGYGLYGVRRDDARDDLRAEGGDVSSALRTSRAVAWVLGAGGRVPLMRRLDLVLRLQYRVRYYDRRAGAALAGRAVHGTQNLTPFIGVSWAFAD